jgi:hypothetical protein
LVARGLSCAALTASGGDHGRHGDSPRGPIPPVWRLEWRRKRQLEGIAKAKAAGVYKGRPVSIGASRVTTASRRRGDCKGSFR